MQIGVHKVAMAAPNDVSGLAELIVSGVVKVSEIVALIGKTEGNGGANDFTRGYATSSYQSLLARHLGISPEEVGKRIAFAWSGGTEGVLSPHVTVFARREVNGGAAPAARLAAGTHHTQAFKPEELGTMAQVRSVERGVREAMAGAGIAAPRDVHFVQIKCPLLTAEQITAAQGRGARVATTNTYASMGYSRGAAALGVAAALGEVDAAALDDSVICKRWDLYSRVASTSAGVELANCEILVLGNAPGAAGDLVIGHDVMEDAIDAAAVRRALASAGAGETVGVFAKAEAEPTGRIRGRRHTMMDDSDINHTRHARAAVAAVIASIVGDPMVYVSGGAEHQGPSGGGPVAAIVRV